MIICFYFNRSLLDILVNYIIIIIEFILYMLYNHIIYLNNIYS